MNVVRIILVTILSFISVICFSTSQISDQIILKNDTFNLQQLPLEEYLNSSGGRELIDFQGCSSTACWDGYKAIWTIEHDSLFLIAIAPCHRTEYCHGKDASLEKMFPGYYKNGKVLAYWYSENLDFSFGRTIRRYDFGLPLKEFSFHYEIKAGLVVNFLSHQNYIDLPHGCDRKDYYEAQNKLYKKIKKHLRFKGSHILNDNYYTTDFRIIVDTNGNISGLEFSYGDSLIKKWIVEALINQNQYDILKFYGYPYEESFYFDLEIFLVGGIIYRIFDLDFKSILLEQRSLKRRRNDW